MDNQHKKIKGYRDLSQQEINDMNDIKAEGERLKKVIALLRERKGLDQRWVSIAETHLQHKKVIALMRERKGLDQRWVSIAETHLQQGIMAAVRAVAQPESF